MTIQLTLEIVLEITGEDYSTGQPNRIWGQQPVSSAQLWQYELQASDNVLPLPVATPPTFLWIDPQPVWGTPVSGATLTLKGVATDMGVALSSYNPSLIPVSTINGGTLALGSFAFLATPQTDVDLACSQVVQMQIGWL